MKNNKTIWDYILLILLFAAVVLTSSCQDDIELYEEVEEFEAVNLKDYGSSWDHIKNYPSEVLNYRTLNYFPDCWLDNTTLLADFDLDGDNDLIVAPDCTDDDQRQPPIKFFINDNGNFYESDIKIENNIGIISGARTSIIGDYNGDLIPDVVFISHNGHGYDFGVPQILLSDGDKFVFRDMTELRKAWYSEGTSGDIDNDGDLDIILSIDNGLLLNDGNANFTLIKDFVLNYPGIGFGVPSLVDLNNDSYLDLIYRDYNTHVIVFNNNGVFDYSNSVKLPMPKHSEVDLDIKDRVIVDYDGDKDLDIITVSVPHDPNVVGYFNFIQVLENKDNSFTDVSDKLLSKQQYNYYIEWLRTYDLDKDGVIEIFEHQKTSKWFKLEFNNESNKLIKQ
jgi:hypothetical protein